MLENNNLPDGNEFHGNEEETQLKRKITCLIEKKQFKEVYDLIEENTFSEKETMIKLWDEAHYREHNTKTPLARFRVREKFIPPPSLCPSGRRKKTTLPQTAKNVMKEWLERNKSHPYPSRVAKERLAKATGLTFTQVTTWFANARRRLHKQNKHQQSKQENVISPWTSTQCIAQPWPPQCVFTGPTDLLDADGLLPELYGNINFGAFHAANILMGIGRSHWVLDNNELKKFLQ